jgi:hypothetical protein
MSRSPDYLTHNSLHFVTWHTRALVTTLYAMPAHDANPQRVRTSTTQLDLIRPGSTWLDLAWCTRQSPARAHHTTPSLTLTTLPFAPPLHPDARLYACRAARRARARQEWNPLYSLPSRAESDYLGGPWVRATEWADYDENGQAQDQD